MEYSNYKNKNIKKKYSSTWHGLLISYIPELIRKILDGFKDKVSFNTNTPKQTAHVKVKKLSKPKTQKQSQENIINSIRNTFILIKEKSN